MGNAVISKKILRTSKIMVMHSNERGECSPCTLVDRKPKRYNNAVDVVVRLHDPTDPSTERTAPPSSAHVQLDDVPRTPIQSSFEGEFRQHDGVVTMMMFYRHRASPKHRYDMTEVDYGGVGHRTRLGDPRDQLLCLWGAPLPLYIKEQGGGGADRQGARQEESYSPFLVGLGEGGRRRERGRKGGRRPPSLSNSD